MVIVVTEKHPKKIFIQVKPLFRSLNLVTPFFLRNACYDVITTSFTIIKPGFLRKLFCYESLVDIEVSKRYNVL